MSANWEKENSGNASSPPSEGTPPITPWEVTTKDWYAKDPEDALLPFFPQSEDSTQSDNSSGSCYITHADAYTQTDAATATASKQKPFVCNWPNCEKSFGYG